MSRPKKRPTRSSPGAPWSVRIDGKGYRLHVRDERTGEVSKPRFACSTYREAEVEAQRRYDELNRHLTGKMPTVGELVRDHLTSIERRSDRHQAKTRHGAQRILNHRVAQLHVDTLTYLDVEQWMGDLADEGLSPETIRAYRGVFKRSLDRAQPLGVIFNVAAAPKVPTEHTRARPERPAVMLDEDEARALIDVCEKPDEDWGPYFITLAMLGLRPGEVLAIQSADVTADRVFVHQAIKRTGSDRAIGFGPLKAGEPRHLILPTLVIEAIERQRAKLADWNLTPQLPLWADMIFMSRAQAGPNIGRPASESTIRVNLSKLCKKAGIRNVTPYDLRHIAASQMIHAGEPMDAVAYKLGHDVRTLRREYQHLLRPATDTGVEAMNRFYRP